MESVKHMMLKVKDKERLFWIYELAQTWYSSGQCSDVILTCLDDQERRVDFSCHKLMVLPLLSKYCSIKCLDYEDIEQVILTDLTPDLLKQYLNYIYGFDISNLDVSGIFNSSSPSIESNIANVIKVKIEEENEDDDFVAKCDEEISNDRKLVTKVPILKLEKRKIETESDDDFMPPVKKKKKKGQKKKQRLSATCYIPSCGETFPRIDYFKAHFLKCHPDVEYSPPVRPKKLPTCRKCDLTFPTQYDAKKHWSQNHEIRKKKKVKEEISNGTENSDKLDGIKSENKEDKAYDPNEDSNYDSSFEEDKTWVPCTHCHQTFSKTSERNKHMIKDHYQEMVEADRIYKSDGQERIKWITCDYDNCEKWFKENRDKVNHIARIHTGEKNFICNFCSKAFLNKGGLTTHLERMHDLNTTGQEKMCNECGECFPNQTQFKYHQDFVHKHKKKDLKCKFCDYETWSKQMFEEHVRTHTGEKPEICKFCGQGFKQKRTRENHERLHTGEKPFQCNFCSSCFAQRTGLNVHVQTHHKEYANDKSIKTYTFVRIKKSD